MEFSKVQTKYEVKFTSAMKKDMKKVVKRHYDLTLFAEIVEKIANGIPLGEKYKAPFILHEIGIKNPKQTNKREILLHFNNFDFIFLIPLFLLIILKVKLIFFLFSFL